MFAQFRCIDVFGENYFTVMYYEVNCQLDKIYIPNYKVKLHVDAMELAILFLQPLAYAEKVEDFSKTSCTDSFIGTVLKGTKHISKDDGAVLFSICNYAPYMESHVLPSIGITPTAYNIYSTNFILAFTANDDWLYEADTKEQILQNIDLVDIFKSLVKNKRYSLRKPSIAYSPFNCDVIFVNSRDPHITKKTLDKMHFMSSIVVNYAGKDCVSILLKSDVHVREWHNILYDFKDDHIIKTEYKVVGGSEEWQNGTHSHMTREHLDYISESLIKCIRELYSSYFN